MVRFLCLLVSLVIDFTLVMLAKIMKKGLISFLILIVPRFGIAQIDLGPRYEQIHNSQTLDYSLIPNGHEGVLLLQREYTSAPEYPFILKHLDKELNVQWEQTLKIKEHFIIKGYYYSENKTYLLIWNRSFHFVKILRIDVVQRKVDEFEARKMPEIDITEFKIVKNVAVIGGVYEERPTVLVYDFERNSLSTLQNIYQSQSKLEEIKVNDDNVTFNVLVSALDEKKDRTIMVNTYDFVGNTIRYYQLEVKPNYQLINGVISSINDVSQVVVGEYSIGKNNMIAGIYVNYIDRIGKQKMTYHNFSELPNYFDFMVKRRVDKLMMKVASELRSGKELQYRRHIQIREIIEKDNKLIITGEVFKQKQFTHVYMMVIDQEGNIEWGDYLAKDKTNTGWNTNLGVFKWFGENNGIYIYYYKKGLHLKIMDGTGMNKILDEQLPLKSSLDELRYERGETIGVAPWYDNNIVVYGVQHVRPRDRSERVRTVFFINKINTGSMVRPFGWKD